MTPTLWGVVVIGALIVLLISAWLLTRDTTGTPPTPPGRHRRSYRDPHDPLRKDDEPPPGDDPGDRDTPSWGDFR